MPLSEPDSTSFCGISAVPSIDHLPLATSDSEAVDDAVVTEAFPADRKEAPVGKCSCDGRFR
jgi:hypothetical protein